MKKVTMTLLAMLIGAVLLFANDTKSIELHIHIQRETEVNMYLQASLTEDSNFNSDSLSVDLMTANPNGEQGIAYFQIMDLSKKGVGTAVPVTITVTSSPFEHEDGIPNTSVATSISNVVLATLPNRTVTEIETTGSNAFSTTVTYLAGVVCDFSQNASKLADFAVSWNKTNTVVAGSYSSVITLNFVSN